MNKPDEPAGGPRPGEDEGFLTRWSRRKREIAVEDKAVEVSSTAPDQASLALQAQPEPDNRPRDPETGEVIDEELVRSLPDLSDIKAGGDLSGFMQRGVPEALRRQALRQMWLADPAIRDYVSPALDYAYDYNAPGGAPGYGPLTESDIAQAKTFLSRVFSTPLEQAATEETAQENGLSDNPSHDVTAFSPEAVRRSDAALQKNQAVPLPELAKTGRVTDPYDTEKPQSGDGIIVQRNMNEPASVVQDEPEHVPQHSQRRRGGGASPV